MNYEDLTLLEPFHYLDLIIPNPNVTSHQWNKVKKLHPSPDPDLITSKGKRMLENLEYLNSKSKIVPEANLYNAPDGFIKVVVCNLFYYYKEMKIPDDRLLPCFFIVKPLEDKHVGWNTRHVNYKEKYVSFLDIGFLQDAFVRPNVVSDDTKKAFGNFVDNL